MASGAKGREFESRRAHHKKLSPYDNHRKGFFAFYYWPASGACRRMPTARGSCKAIAPAVLRSAKPADQGLELGPNPVFNFQLLLQFGNGGLGFFNGAAQAAEQ